MFKIHTLNKISAAGLALFPADKYEIGGELNTADAVILRSADMHEIDFNTLPGLKSIARAGAGVNNIPIPACSEKGIVVFNTPGANANAVAELVLLGMLASARPIVKGTAWAKTLMGNGEEVPKMVEKGKGQFVGPEIKGKTLGIIGLGAIGAIVANDAAALGMKIIGFDPFLSEEGAKRLPAGIQIVKDLKEIYAACDYITLHIPQTPETKNTIKAETIAMMKDGVRVLNFARGGLVNSADMIEALKAGKVACYVTDFGDDALLGAENAIVLPHLGASTPEAEENCAYMAVRQTMDFLEKGDIINSVNFPKTVLPVGNAAQRLAITALKNADFAAQIAKIAKISAMAVQTRGDISYAIVELSAAIDTKAIAIDGLVSVRVL
jgi:D-3-phosphoglycerate dehydrogenase